METCPNCGKTIKHGVLNTNLLIRNVELDIIREVVENPAENYCTKCGERVFSEAHKKLRSVIASKKEQLQEYINIIPISSIHSPMGWQYRTIGVVTAQSVTGTGVFSELSMSISDIFGSESTSMNTKIRDAEKACFERIRKDAVMLGGNAIVGLDIDYSEVGSLRGMMMVCCTGTAIEVTNLNEIDCKLCEAAQETANILGILERYQNLNLNYQTNV